MNVAIYARRIGLSRLLAITTLAGSIPVAAQQQTLSAAKYCLKPVYQTGRIDRYKVELHVTDVADTKMTGAANDVTKEAERFDLRAHAVLRETIKQVEQDGTALIEDHVERVNAVLNGMTFDVDTGEAATQVKGWTSTRTCDRYGCVRSTKALYNGEGRFDPQGGLERAFAPDGNLALQILSPLFPPHPVRNGDTWKALFGPGTATPPTMNCTLMGRERMGGTDSYRVKMAAQICDKQNGTAFYQATGSIEARTGRYLRLESTLTGGPLHTAKATLILTLIR